MRNPVGVSGLNGSAAFEIPGVARIALGLE
ncbi:Uncharacterised protein [Mycobacteroides abscessus subsp. abscessus]|nr:Uncharacterised protein [Mycobacteroides abscessus subsp. abscessus]SLG91581.1 Uncharacterised protein [Mycobacteroides abscessus subsp. abscessus]